jgi:hypothetical protein
MEMSVQSRAAAAILIRKGLRYTSNTVGTDREYCGNGKISSSAGIQTPDRLAHSLVTKLTTLSGFLLLFYYYYVIYLIALFLTTFQRMKLVIK